MARKEFLKLGYHGTNIYKHSISHPGETISERKIRGSVLNGYLKYIKKRWGQKGISDASEVVGFDLDIVVDGRWYAEEFSTQILGWIRDEKGAKYIEECGRYTVKDLGILSYIVRFATIKIMLKKVSVQFRDAFNYGKMEVDIHENIANIKMQDNAIDENTCPTWVGMYKGLLELTNTKGTVKEVQCQLKGAPYCVFEMEWD